EGLRFNVALARLYELVNALGAAMAAPGERDEARRAAIREAADLLVLMIAPMMPHLAEEAWHLLGHADLVAEAPWPELDRSLLADDTILLPIQINGKKRAELTIGADASQAEVEAATLAHEAVRAAPEGRPPRKVIVVPKRIVNVVV